MVLLRRGAFRSTGRVAALSWLKSVSSVCHCLVSRLYFQRHDTLPVSKFGSLNAAE